MFIRLILLAILTITPAVLHGYLTYRWTSPADFSEHVEFVKGFPKTLGGWTSVSEGEPIRPEVIKELGVTDHFSRNYTSGRNSVLLSILTGKTGRLIRHTPDICYESVGHKFLSDPKPVSVTVDGVEHQFRVLPIQPLSATSSEFVVVYGFALNGQFRSPANPRFEYHGEPAIEKIQILCAMDPDPSKLEQIPDYARPFVESVCRYVQQNQPRN